MANTAELSNRTPSIIPVNKARRLAAKICLFYCCVAVLGVLVAGKVPYFPFPILKSLNTRTIYELLGFIVISASLLYLLLASVFSRRELAAMEQARNEAAVRENRDRLKRILDSMFTFVSVLTLDGILVEVNRAPLEIAELKPEDVIGKPFAETYWWLHSPETQHRLRQCLKRAAGGETVRCDFEVRVANNRLITIDFVVNPLRNADNQIIELAASAVDITARKRAEDELRETSERFHQLAGHITDVFWMRSADFSKVIYVSPGFEKVWARPVEELYSNPAKWVDFIFVEDRDRVAAAFGHFQIDTEALDIEYRIVWPSGEIRWIRARGFQVRDENGQIIRYAGIITDINDRKMAEAALRKSEAQLRAMFDGAAVGIALVGPENKPVHCNPAICRMLGYSESELYERTFDTLTHPEDLEGSASLFRSLRAGEREHYEIIKRYIRKDGQIMWGRLTVSLVKQEKDAPLLVIGMLENITESRRLEEQMRQAQKMEAIGKLAGGVAHDFNNILAVIQMQAGMLNEDSQLPPLSRKLAAEIIKSSERAANLTRQLLLFSRRQVVQAREHDLNQIVSNITDMLRRVLGEDIVMQFKWAMQRLCILADSGMVDQILMNLAVNARDAMPDGGKLVIGTAVVNLDAAAAAIMPHARPGSFACLTISDTGCGISPEVLSHIFEPFFTTKGVGKGTGLGLATVFGIVEQHQGWINVDSKVGCGTTFRIYFPLVEKPSVTGYRPPAPAPSMRSGNETILLVEDDPALRVSVETTLARLGYSVRTASNGNEALELWKKHRHEIHLLLTDLVMPGMNGRVLASELLADNPALKVVYTSGYATDVANSDFDLQEGVNFLQKPYRPERLSETLRSALDR